MLTKVSQACKNLPQQFPKTLIYESRILGSSTIQCVLQGRHPHNKLMCIFTVGTLTSIVCILPYQPPNCSRHDLTWQNRKGLTVVCIYVCGWMCVQLTMISAGPHIICWNPSWESEVVGKLAFFQENITGRFEKANSRTYREFLLTAGI